MIKQRSRPRRSQAPEQGDGALYIESLSALADYLSHRPDIVEAVYCRDELNAKVDALLGPKLSLRRPLSELPEEERRRASLLLARVRLSPLGEKEFLPRAAKRERSIVVALDHVTDPRNLGAIARSAAFFGVREILVAKDRQVLLTRASVATAQGAFALTDLVVVTNLSRTLEQLKEAGYWLLGAAMAGESLEAVAGVYDKVVLVLGAEDKGLASGIAGKCDRLVTIAGASERLDSLNVSVAAGIMLRGLFLGKKA